MSIISNKGMSLADLLKYKDFSQVNQNLWFEVDGIYMTVEEIYKLQIQSQIQPFVNEFLEDVYKHSIFLIKYLDWDSKTSTYSDFKNMSSDPLNLKRGSNVVKVRTQSIDSGGFSQGKHKQSICPPTLQEVENEEDDDEIQEKNEEDLTKTSLEDLRQKALEKASHYGQRPDQTQFSGGKVGFMNKLKQKNPGLSESQTLTEYTESQKSQTGELNQFQTNKMNRETSTNYSRNNNELYDKQQKANTSGIYSDDSITKYQITSDYNNSIKPKNLTQQFERVDQNYQKYSGNSNIKSSISSGQENQTKTNMSSRLTSLQITQQLLEQSQKLIESTQQSMSQQKQSSSQLNSKNISPEKNQKNQQVKKIQAKKTEGMMSNDLNNQNKYNQENTNEPPSQNIIVYEGEKFIIPNHYSPPKIKKPIYSELSSQIAMTASQQKHRRTRSDRFN